MKNGKPSVGSWGPACPAPPWQGAEAKKHLLWSAQYPVSVRTTTYSELGAPI
jgi:hypothetical protein